MAFTNLQIVLIVLVLVVAWWWMQTVTIPEGRWGDEYYTVEITKTDIFMSEMGVKTTWKILGVNKFGSYYVFSIVGGPANDKAMIVFRTREKNLEVISVHMHKLLRAL